MAVISNRFVKSNSLIISSTVIVLLLKGVFTFFDVGHMLNPPVSNVPPLKGFFLDHPFGLQVPKRGAPKPSEGFGAIFSPFFPSHRRTL